MAIIYDKNTITLNTANSTYQMGIGKYGFLLHNYYGKKITGDMGYLVNYRTRAYSLNPNDSGRDRTFALDALPFEYPCYGSGDFRASAFNMKTRNGTYGCDLRYVSHEIKPGKYNIPGLPAVYANKAETLEVVLADTVSGVEVTLLYGVIEELDVITRAVSVKNTSGEDIIITKALSGTLDFLTGDFDILHFPGKQGMEHIQKRFPVIQGKQSFGSLRGASSHQHNPFVILAGSSATEDTGACFGMMLLYSGNFICEADHDQYHQTRISMGLQDEMFEYALKPGEIFHTPEVAYAFSGCGLASLSHKYHKLINHHIVRGMHKDAMRPVLVNSWEAAYFDFDGEKLISIAEKSAKLGVEMLVLDDGWFGDRRADASGGLGDWYVNEDKLGMPLSKMVEKINNLGMKFGIWIEPEMISTDSTLYRAHPDWAYAIPGRPPAWGRNQLVLDFSRKEVVDNIFNQIAAVMDSANIEYIKMDMNRSLMDIYSATETRQNAGATMHKFMLGVYDFLERLNTRYPHVLIEG
ncbi:MAG: alpha-galactosidase, partial [Defluviitaleaceae bacterium]|nr:alpha-galactosidase [Defluviitaleaceae bacterium]